MCFHLTFSVFVGILALLVTVGVLVLDPLEGTEMRVLKFMI